MIRLTFKLAFLTLLLSCSQEAEMTPSQTESKLEENFEPQDAADSLHTRVETLKKEIESMPNSTRRKELEENLKMMIEVLKFIDERDNFYKQYEPDSTKLRKFIDSMKTNGLYPLEDAVKTNKHGV